MRETTPHVLAARHPLARGGLRAGLRCVAAAIAWSSLACSGRTTDSMGTSDTTAADPSCGRVWQGSYDETTPDLLVGHSEVTGSVSLCCSEAEDLRPWQCLQRIDGSLRLLWNDSLTTLAGLEQLSHVGYDLQLLDPLTDISALGGLTSIGHDLEIGSPALASLHGLEGIARVEGDLRIAGVAPLRDLQGLNALEEVVGSFRVYGDDSLVNMSGVDSLRRVGAFEATHDRAMTNLDGLEGVAHFGEHFELYDNASLIDIAGALGGKVDRDARIQIFGNPLLPACEAEKLADSLEPPDYTGYRAVFDNLGTCP
ncbi:hypothetical protein [Nannocystis pusilla]|uniref:Receptor L-domain domain-containing protein n=1 Tax=Nannocystis pusilla TaxID=889268 RepID=A0ABS7TX91_9BACT|nr:hypothetical protein [Nannocystis pusilla]MBZ5712757.1 hypothetical protein [Nannocystis pusilla]